MSTRQLLFSAWDWEPSVVVGCVALLVIFFAVARVRDKKCSAYYVAGILILLLSLASPIDTLGDTYLFSAHMLQHLLLVLAVAPLLLLGIPASLVNRVLAWPLARSTERVLSNPVLAWSLAIGVMAIWHLAVLYNAALASESIHIVQHLSFLVTATIFWWPLLAPVPLLRLQPPAAVMYLFAAIIANTVLGAVITFAPVGLYPAYLAPKDDLGILPLIRERWELSPGLDQQRGGLLMWVPGCGVYLGAILFAITRWLGGERPRDQRLAEPHTPAHDATDARRARTSNHA
jgi:putative membrane protein